MKARKAGSTVCNTSSLTKLNWGKRETSPTEEKADGDISEDIG